jgi:hypothetical protein
LRPGEAVERERGDIGLDGGKTRGMVRAAGVGVVVDAHDACFCQRGAYAQAGAAGAAEGDDDEAAVRHQPNSASAPCERWLAAISQ